MIGAPRVGGILVDEAPLFMACGLCDMHSIGLGNANANNMHFIGQVVGQSGWKIQSDNKVIMLAKVWQMVGRVQ